MSAQDPKLARRVMKTWQRVMSRSEGKISSQVAKRLMKQFCVMVSQERRVPKEMLFYFRDAFQDYLMGKKTIEAALGLTKGKKGRRKTAQSKQIEMAAKVLELRIDGKTFLDAVEDAKEYFKSRGIKGAGTTAISEAWGSQRIAAYEYWVRQRSLGQKPLTPEEKERITEIYEGKIRWGGPDINSKKSFLGADVTQEN